MVLHLIELPDQYATTLESCPCHPIDFDDDCQESRSRFKRQKVYMHQAGLTGNARRLEHCPANGCHAPDLASGKHLLLLKRLIARHVSAFMKLCVALNVDGDVKDTVMESWDAGILGLEMVIT